MTPQGATSFVWDGKSDNGPWVADGRYRSVVSAQTRLGAYTQERSVFVGAFQVNPSITSPARGGTITLNIVSSEGLDRSPTVTVTQPGFEPWTVTAKRISGKKYKVKITLKSGGGEGIVDFVVSGVDSKGGHQSSSLRLPLR